MTRPQLAREAAVSVDSLEDVELGRTRINGPALFRLVGLLDGSYEQVAALLEMEENEDSAEDARALAQLWAIRPAATGDRRLTAEEQRAELWEIALRRTGGDRDQARRLLLRALDELLGSEDYRMMIRGETTLSGLCTTRRSFRTKMPISL